MDELNITVDELNIRNEKLYRKTKNQERKILRLKKIKKKQNEFLKKAKIDHLDDIEWQDVDDLLKKYNK